MQKIILSALLFTVISFSQDKMIYRNNQYSIDASSIREGTFHAEVVDGNAIRSNYKPAFSENFNRVLIYKFAINGSDNEREPGLDHRVYLNPENGFFKTHTAVFGKDDPAGSDKGDGKDFSLLPNQVFEVLFSVDMREIFNDFKTKGFFTTYTGGKILSQDFEGVYIAGSMEPLTWDFGTLSNNKKFKLTDPDGDGIYEIKLVFNNSIPYLIDEQGYAVRQLKNIPAGLPVYSSEYPLLNAIYKMSIEEMLQNIREDGAYMAGAKWTGVWTRDVSYSILLSLAIAQPDVCKTTLMAKVQNGIIIQDTGTGGAWPVSTDRMIWALAAFEVYKTTGDLEWLKLIYPIIRKSMQQDSITVFDATTGLVKGESSFLDWREQTYPKWMEPIDIYESLNLGTNAVHAAAYKAMHEICILLHKDENDYMKRYKSISNAINTHLWSEEKGYYGQFMYGGMHKVLSQKSETLGEALTVLTGIAGDRAESVIKNMPVLVYGSPSVFPQEQGIPPYHNNGIWPFVEAFRMLAAKDVGNEEAMLHSLAGLLRQAGLFLTNKENFVADNGNCVGTEINSDRQLWSVAGTLSIIYRVLFGLEGANGSFYFKPHIPESLKGTHILKNLKLGNGVYTISVTGYGNEIGSMKIDGKETKERCVYLNESGHHNIEILLKSGTLHNGQNLTGNYFAPPTPTVQLRDGTLYWQGVETVKKYIIYKNGLQVHSQSELYYKPVIDVYVNSYQVSAVDGNGVESFLSAPKSIHGSIDNFPLMTNEGVTQMIELNSVPGETHSISFSIDEPGEYALRFTYSNGNGPINTDNKCAIRSVFVDEEFVGVLVLPQRGIQNWESRGYSNMLNIQLSEGVHRIRLVFDELNTNMNFTVNQARIHALHLERYGK